MFTGAILPQTTQGERLTMPASPGLIGVRNRTRGYALIFISSGARSRGDG